MYFCPPTTNYLEENCMCIINDSLSGYVTEQQENFIEKQLDLEDTFRSLSLNHSTVFIDKPLNTVTAKEIVLRRCGQTEPLPFEECYPPRLVFLLLFSYIVYKSANNLEKCIVQ